jgi:PAS domain-containing protein
MKNLTVHVLKPAHLESGHAEDAFRVAQQVPGPLQYELVEWDFDVPRYVELAKADYHVPPRSEESAPSYAWGSIWSGVRKRFGKEKLTEIETRQPLPSTPPSQSMDEFMRDYQRIEAEYRRLNAVPAEDVVIFLTLHGHFENFLVVPGFTGERMGTIQLNHEVMQSVPGHLLVGYYLFALPVLLIAYADESLESYLERFAHTTPQGCLNDLCQDDVRALMLKTKTADVCPSCKADFRDRQLDWDLVRQMRNGFEVVRQLQLNLEDFLDGCSLPNMTLGVRIEFKDLGIAVPLSPKEAAVYETFLEAGQAGIALHDLDTHREQLHDAYARRYTGSDREAISRVVNRLIDPLDSDLQQVISKINKKFKAALSTERAAPFLIEGNRNEPKKVAVPRQHIRRS